MNDKLLFAPEEKKDLHKKTSKFKVLIVDDDHEVHSFTKLALKDFCYADKEIEFISAYSGAEARTLLQQHDDAAVILLDIVMETSSAGLDVVKHIRHVLRNDMIRIIIRTGQPGEAPERFVIDNYDINDYKEKTELTTDRLYTTLRTALAQYSHLQDLQNKKNEIYTMLITDKLTSLPNRVKLNYDIDSLKHQSLILIDIDRFSLINDAYGFEVGDSVLIHTKNIMQRLLRKDMTLYRLESDLFAILMDEVDKETLSQEVDTIKAFLDNSPLEIGNISLYISVTVGIVHYQLGNIIQKAEIALKQARTVGRNRVEYYSDSLDLMQTISTNNEWTFKIIKAIEKDDILVYFQPIVDCKTDKIVKYEALIRLRYKDEIFGPFYFLDTARYSGYLTKLTNIVFEKSCKKFQDKPYKFSVNITDVDLADVKFIDFVEKTRDAYNIDRSRIVFEILEESSISNNLLANENLKKLTDLGYALSIDDFGTQCSNFSQLGEHHYESIKIDGKFIRDLNINEKSKIITKSILFFTNQIGFKTVAEFVHSKEIYDIVKEMGVDYAQGYFLGEPKPELVEDE